MTGPNDPYHARPSIVPTEYSPEDIGGNAGVTWREELAGRLMCSVAAMSVSKVGIGATVQLGADLAAAAYDLAEALIAEGRRRAK